MEIVMSLAAILSVAYWLISELAGSRTSRIILGFVSIVLVAYMTYWIGQIIPRYEIGFYHSSLKNIETLMDQRRYSEIKEVLSAYNTLDTKKDRYSRALIMSGEFATATKKKNTAEQGAAAKP